MASRYPFNPSSEMAQIVCMGGGGVFNVHRDLLTKASGYFLAELATAQPRVTFRSPVSKLDYTVSCAGLDMEEYGHTSAHLATFIRWLYGGDIVESSNGLSDEGYIRILFNAWNFAAIMHAIHYQDTNIDQITERLFKGSKIQLSPLMNNLVEAFHDVNDTPCRDVVTDWLVHGNTSYSHQDIKDFARNESTGKPLLVEVSRPAGAFMKSRIPGTPRQPPHIKNSCHYHPHTQYKNRKCYEVETR